MSYYFTDPYYFGKAIASLVLLAQVAGIGTILAALLFRTQAKGVLDYLKVHSIGLALIVAVTAVGSSLIFSDYFDMAPCKLCWYQRIFIFPQVVILAVALWRKHSREIIDYSITLACIAIPISIFHYVLQMSDAPAVHSFAPCDVTGQAPSCSGFYVIMYGYITIPLMALTTSGLILVLGVLRKF